MLSARFRPKSCRRSGAGKQHGADLLKLVDDIDLIAAVDMAEGVVAAGSPGGIERVEEQGGLAQFLSRKPAVASQFSCFTSSTTTDPAIAAGSG
jgi:hypothetical protein